MVDQFDGEGVHFTHLHPKDVGGAILSIDAMVPPSRWQWGGPDWQDNVRTEVSARIVGGELQGPDPDRMSARWAAVLGRPRSAGEHAWHIPLDGGELRFVQDEDGRGEGLRGFDVAVRDPAAVRMKASARGTVDGEGEVVLCGARVRLVQA